jgi:hypothetical protein
LNISICENNNFEVDGAYDHLLPNSRIQIPEELNKLGLKNLGDGMHPSSFNCLGDAF